MPCVCVSDGPVVASSPQTVGLGIQSSLPVVGCYCSQFRKRTMGAGVEEEEGRDVRCSNAVFVQYFSLKIVPQNDVTTNLYLYIFASYFFVILNKLSNRIYIT